MANLIHSRSREVVPNSPKPKQRSINIERKPVQTQSRRSTKQIERSRRELLRPRAASLRGSVESKNDTWKMIRGNERTIDDSILRRGISG